MPILNLTSPVFISVDGAGRPNAGGTVGVYVAGTSFGTLATIYSDQQMTTAIANPATMDAAGTKEIWFNVKADIREKTKTGVLIRDTLNLDPNATATASTNFNLAQNGSFEIDSDSDTQPDSWTITPYSGSAIAITESVVTNGTKALEFNTAAASTGGGTATSAKFPVTEGSNCHVEWSFYATNATTLNLFQIKWYNEIDVLQSTSTLTMPASGSVPTSWTNYADDVTAAAGATQGEIVLTGISSGGSNLSSKAYFDGIYVINMPIVTLTDTQTLTNKTLTAPTITSAYVDELVDSNGNEIVILGEVASAVNELTVTNAASGNKPSINQTGTDDAGLDIEGVELHNGITTSLRAHINDAAATERRIFYQTAGVNRWETATNSSAEDGFNAGSNFVIRRYNDAGTFIGESLIINRATGLLTISNLAPSSAGTAIAGQATGGIGTYAFLGNNAITRAPGETELGSALAYCDSSAAGTSSPSGTWRCMGNGTATRATVWLRIS